LAYEHGSALSAISQLRLERLQVAEGVSEDERYPGRMLRELGEKCGADSTLS